MQGYKTWIGILVTVLGLIGFGDIVSADQLADVIDAVLKIVGIAVTVYGNIKAHSQIKMLGGYSK